MATTGCPLNPGKVDEVRLKALRAQGQADLEKAKNSEYVRAIESDQILEQLADSKPDFIFTKDFQVWSDNPLKALDHDSPMSRSLVLRGLTERMRQATRRIALISAYFVPGEQGTRMLSETRKRGVEIDVVTNSLAANDVAAVHGGYANTENASSQRVPACGSSSPTQSRSQAVRRCLAPRPRACTPRPR